MLDEPAAGLDPLGKEEIMTLLHKIHQDWCSTVIIVSHDMDEIAENCTGAAVFSEGKVWEFGPVASLFNREEELRRMGLDVSFTAKLVQALERRGVLLDCNLTTDDFVVKVLKKAKGAGAGMDSIWQGGRNDA